MPNQRGVMSLKSNSSHCNILTFNLLKQNVTSDEFFNKNIFGSAAIMINRMADLGAYLDKCMHLNAVLYPVAAPLHQPFRRTRGSADAYRVDAFYPFALNLVGTFNKITVRINALALVE